MAIEIVDFPINSMVIFNSVPMCTPKPNGFADHDPYEKWLAIIGNIPNIFRQTRIDMIWRWGDWISCSISCSISCILSHKIKTEFEWEELVHWDPHWPRIFPARFSPLPIFGGSFGSSCDSLRSASCLWWKTAEFFSDNHGESSNQGTKKRGTKTGCVSLNWPTRLHVSLLFNGRALPSQRTLPWSTS